MKIWTAQQSAFYSMTRMPRPLLVLEWAAMIFKVLPVLLAETTVEPTSHKNTTVLAASKRGSSRPIPVEEAAQYGRSQGRFADPFSL